jgi:hypothetical protein
VHSSLQQGEGRDTVRSECDDFPVEDGFAVIEHRAERVHDLGNDALMLLSLRDQSTGDSEPVVVMALWPSHFDSKAQRSPVGGCPSVASIGGTGFPVVALIPSTVRWFVLVSADFRRLKQ